VELTLHCFQEKSMTVVNKLKSLTARVTMNDQDVRSLLVKDHEEAKELLNQIMDASQASRRMRLFQQLKTALTAHSRAEERAVYNRMLNTKSNDSRELADEGFVEHGIIDGLLAQLSSGGAGETRWLATAKALKELLEHHIDEEQTDTFAELGEHFDSDQLEEMGVAFQRAKAALMSRQSSPHGRKASRKIAARSPRRAPAKKATRAAQGSRSRQSRSAK